MEKNTKYLTYKEFITDIINAELRPYDICMLDLEEINWSIDGVPWYQYFTFKTEDGYIEWRNYVKKKLPKCIVFKFTPETEYEKIINKLDLAYGLIQEYELQ